MKLDGDAIENWQGARQEKHTFDPSASANRAKVLAFSDYYLPGYKAGGAMRSIVNLVERMGDEIEFRVVTRDRDLGDSTHYPGIVPGRWTRVGRAHVWYLPTDNYSVCQIASLLQSTPCDVLYFNSLFSRKFTLVPLLLRRLGFVPARPVVLAPRGELGRGALSLKKRRKFAYLIAARLLGIFRDVTWQASSRYEEADIRRSFGMAKVTIAQDLLAPQSSIAPRPAPPAKRCGELRLVFFSRIARMKNLHWAIGLLGDVQADVVFDIYGPKEDESYWAVCEAVIATLPVNVRVCYHGPVDHDAVMQVLSIYHLFFLPTLGENFSYVIFEALQSGCLVLTSDQTPWRGLEERAVGWCVPLEDEARFKLILQRCVDMDAEEFGRLSARARTYATELLAKDEALDNNRQLFRSRAKVAGRANAG
ncbi:MAG: glycosyltransferase family 4 protein [Gammaproteobacteria bacterium]